MQMSPQEERNSQNYQASQERWAPEIPAYQPNPYGQPQEPLEYAAGYTQQPPYSSSEGQKITNEPRQFRGTRRRFFKEVVKFGLTAGGVVAVMKVGTLLTEKGGSSTGNTRPVPPQKPNTVAQVKPYEQMNDLEKAQELGKQASKIADSLDEQVKSGVNSVGGEISIRGNQRYTSVSQGAVTSDPSYRDGAYNYTSQTNRVTGGVEGVRLGAVAYATVPMEVAQRQNLPEYKQYYQYSMTKDQSSDVWGIQVLAPFEPTAQDGTLPPSVSRLYRTDDVENLNPTLLQELYMQALSALSDGLQTPPVPIGEGNIGPIA
jgi:hypothetical protein